MPFGNYVLYHIFLLLEFKHRFYRYDDIPTDGINYNDAKVKCRSVGKTLPMLKTQNEQLLWKKMVAENSNILSAYWVGSERAQTNLKFNWNDATPNDHALVTESHLCLVILSQGYLDSKSCTSNVLELFCEGKLFVILVWCFIYFINHIEESFTNLLFFFTFPYIIGHYIKIFGFDCVYV